MALRRPQPGDKVNYFTNRVLDNGKGFAKVWRFEGEEKANIEYKCPSCGHAGEKQQVFEREKVSIINPNTGKKKKADAFIIACDKCGAEMKLEKWTKSMGRKKAA